MISLKKSFKRMVYDFKELANDKEVEKNQQNWDLDSKQLKNECWCGY